MSILVISVCPVSACRYKQNEMTNQLMSEGDFKNVGGLAMGETEGHLDRPPLLILL